MGLARCVRFAQTPGMWWKFCVLWYVFFIALVALFWREQTQSPAIPWLIGAMLFFSCAAIVAAVLDDLRRVNQ